MPTTVINPNAVQPIYPIVRNEAGELIHQTPEVFHHSYVKGQSQAAEMTREAFKGISRTLAGLNAKRVNFHPNYENDVRSGFYANGDGITRARQALKEEASSIEDKLIAQAGFKVDPARRAYVVGTFMALGPNERVTAIGQLIEEGGHGSELAILAEVSGVFSGLTPEMKAGIKSRLYAKTDAHAFGQLQQTQANLARVEAASIENANACAKFAAPQYRAEPARNEVHKSVAG